MNVIPCLSCQAELRFHQNPRIGNMVRCHKCDAEFQVVWLKPLEIEWPWEDEDEYQEEEYYEEDY